MTARGKQNSLSNTNGDNKVSLSIVVPAYNEEALIIHTIEHLLNISHQWVDDFEVIIVDDGSSDKTPEIIDQLAQKYDTIHAYHQNPNRGFGATVRKGFENSAKHFVMVCPVDYLFTLEDFDIYLALIKYSDIVIGYRRHRRQELPFYRRLVSSVYHTMVNIFFKLNFFDVNWIHMYHREQIPLFIGDSEGVFFLAENIIKAKRLGLKITGVDVNYIERPAGVATGIKPLTILKTVRELLSFYFRQMRT
jgi:dolichol-phosphate mannosyltransferase